jgi:hypothetical protein
MEPARMSALVVVDHRRKPLRVYSSVETEFPHRGNVRNRNLQAHLNARPEFLNSLERQTRRFALTARCPLNTSRRANVKYIPKEDSARVNPERRKNFQLEFGNRLRAQTEHSLNAVASKLNERAAAFVARYSHAGSLPTPFAQVEETPGVTSCG